MYSSGVILVTVSHVNSFLFGRFSLHGAESINEHRNAISLQSFVLSDPYQLSTLLPVYFYIQIASLPWLCLFLNRYRRVVEEL